jgi:hypothetical protein
MFGFVFSSGGAVPFERRAAVWASRQRLHSVNGVAHQPEGRHLRHADGGGQRGYRLEIRLRGRTRCGQSLEGTTQQSRLL